VDDVLTVHGVINSDRVVVDVATVKDLMITPVSEPPMPLVAYRGTQSDISGNNLTLTSVSAMTFAVSDDTFVYMEGTSRFAVATLTSGVNSSEVVTLCSWVYMPSYGGAILHNGVNSLSLEPDTLTLRCTDAGTLQLFRTDVEITTIETIPLNTWVHVAAVSNGNGDTVQFYIDGIPTESIANTAGITWSALGGSAFAIGRRNGFGAVTGQRWAGTRLYQDALTAEQVLQARAADHPGIAVGVIPATSDAEADLLGTSLNGVYLKAGALHVRLS